LSLAYSGQKLSPGQALDYNVSIAHNLPLGSQYTNIDGNTDRYSYLTAANRSTRDDFNILRFGSNYLASFYTDWQFRIGMSMQYSGTPLVAAEQIGLAGSTAVRGFNERAVSADSGFFANTEIYTPELAAAAGWRGSLRALAFYDIGRGVNHGVPAGSLTAANMGLASIGAGVRYGLGKDFSVRLDVAQVLDSGPPTSAKERGDWRGHLYMMYAF
jgi:hemolysin activation/secretion protein